MANLCQSESCCTGAAVQAGSFMMGRSEVTGASDAYGGGYARELPAHSVTLSRFVLDKYEVTVGRFRKFAAAYADGWRPTAGAGAHPSIAGSGWQASFGASLPEDAATLSNRLKCDASRQTWSDAPEGHEQSPINCVNWYEAMAFCIWDGGWLPTEAEWEFAAAGGGEERLYPWGSAFPSVDTGRANSYYSDYSSYVAVGSHPTGAGRWGHLDLAGSVWEWTLDWFSDTWYAGASASGADPCNLTPATYRIYRGGSWNLLGDDGYLRGAYRNPGSPSNRYNDLGLRCARLP